MQATTLISTHANALKTVRIQRTKRNAALHVWLSCCSAARQMYESNGWHMDGIWMAFNTGRCSKIFQTGFLLNSGSCWKLPGSHSWKPAVGPNEEEGLCGQVENLLTHRQSMTVSICLNPNNNLFDCEDAGTSANIQ